MTWFDIVADKILRLAGVDSAEFQRSVPSAPTNSTAPSSDIGSDVGAAMSENQGAYRPFTSEFDLVCSVDELSSVLTDRSVSVHQLPSPNDFETNAIAEWMEKYAVLPQWRSRQVTLLIDHSGSMRNGGTLKAALAARVFAQVLSAAGARFEILGFTTQSWKGGRSRVKWLTTGRPRQPGRLCDLLHIVYHPSRTGDWLGRLGAMLDPELLRENVDGEAVRWAVGRFAPGEDTKKLLIVLGDGVPGDDSTDASNAPGLLASHLEAVLKEIAETKAIRLAAVRVSGASGSSLYPDTLFAETSEATQAIILSVLADFATEG